jgi:hypothetical protein
MPWCTNQARKASMAGFFVRKATACGVNLDIMVDTTSRILMQKSNAREAKSAQVHGASLKMTVDLGCTLRFLIPFQMGLIFHNPPKSGGFFWVPEPARQNTIIPGQDCFLPEPVILVHSRNQARIQNGNNLTTNILLHITFFFCKYFMAIQTNQSIPHHIIIIAKRPEPEDEAMRRTGIPWQKE